MANKPLTNVDSIATTKEEDLFFVNSDQKVKQVKKSNLKFNYETHVENKPSINNIELSGNKSLDELGIGNKTDIATLNEEMELLAPAIICTASGKSIKVDDSAERRMQGFDLFGKTEQTKTNGYQLFDASKLPTKSQGGATVTNNGDGSFTVSGSGNITEQFGIRTDLSHAQTKELLQEGKTVTYNKSKSNVTPYFYVQFINETGVIKEFNNTSEASFTITQEMLNNPNFVMSYGFYGGVGNSIEPGTIKPMLYQEGDGTWEPFTGGEPSPSPDYLQEIQGIGEEKEDKYAVEAKTNGKNLLDADEYYSDMKVGDVFEDTANNFYLVKIPLPKQFIGKKLTFSALLYQVNASSNIRCSARIGGNVNDGNGSSKMNEWFLSKISFTMMNESDTIFFNYGSSNNVRIKNIQLEENSEPTSYETHKLTEASIRLDQPLYEGDKIYLEDGELWEYRENAKVVFDGSEDEGWFGYSSTDTEYIFCIRDINLHAQDIKQYCNRFRFRYSVAHPYNGLFAVGTNSIYFGISKTLTSDSQQWKSWLQSNPIEVVYKLETPTIKKLGKIEDFGELKTYYPITHITNNEDAEMVVEYVADTKNYVQNEIEKVKNQINNMAAIILNK